MELSENERLMLVNKKDEISKITSELVTGDLSNSQKIAKINEIISLLSVMESYAKPDRDLSTFTRLALQILLMLETGMDADLLIAAFCTAANAIKFDLTRRRLTLPKKIVIHIENIFTKMGLP